MWFPLSPNTSSVLKLVELFRSNAFGVSQSIIDIIETVLKRDLKVVYYIRFIYFCGGVKKSGKSSGKKNPDALF